MSDIDAGLIARGVELVTLPEGIGEDALIAALHDADLLLSATPPSRRASLKPRRNSRASSNTASASTRSTSRPRSRGIPVRERPGIRRGDGGRRRLRADDRARQKTAADRAEMDAKVGLADAAMARARSRRPDSGLVEPAGSGAAWRGWRAAFAMRVIGYDPNVSGESMRQGPGRGHREDRRPSRAAATERRRFDPCGAQCRDAGPDRPASSPR